MLKDNDAQAADCLNDHEDLLRAAFPQSYRSIDDAIKIFDFEVALDALKTAMLTIGLEVAA